MTSAENAPAARPITVLDLSVLRRPSKLVLPEGFDVALPHILGGEIIDSRKEDEPNAPEMLARKFQQFCKDNAGGIWIGHDWHEIARQEPLPSTSVIGNGWIDRRTTDHVRRWASVPGHSWADSVAAILNSNAGKTYKDQREFFRKWVKAIGIRYSKHDPTTAGDLSKGQIDYDLIRQLATDGKHIANLVLSLGPKAFTDKFKPKPWQDALRSSPDQYAIGRWCRIMYWYGLLWTAKRTSDFDNHWDDAHYIFLASYTGRLATRDKGIMKCVNAVFPHVTVLDLQT